jgi:hypothetical protein
MAVLQPEINNWIYGLIGALALILFTVLLIAIRKMLDSREPPKQLPKLTQEVKTMINPQEYSTYPTQSDPTTDPKLIELIGGIQKEIREMKQSNRPKESSRFPQDLDELISQQRNNGVEAIEIIKELEAAKFRLMQ